MQTHSHIFITGNLVAVKLGGTTWEGTKDKLAMPGVLFHHITATKDYFHDDLAPWIHYIPVDADLTDLRERYEWAEANQDKAREISERGTKFAKKMATPEYMEKMYQKYFIDSLRQVVEAYQPTKEEESKETMKKMLAPLTLIGKCSGDSIHCHYTKDPH